MGEDNDCTVRAAVVRFATSYARAHELMETIAGRRPKRGVKGGKIIEFLNKMGLIVCREARWARPTLAQFLKDHPTGRWYVVLARHAVGVNNGKPVDTLDPGSRSRVWFYA